MAQQNAWKLECTEKGTHSDDEREKIMVAIQFTLSMNAGATDRAKIYSRLKEKGFTKMMITKGNLGNNTVCALNSGNGQLSKYSYWKVNGQLYDIKTDVVLK